MESGKFAGFTLLVLSLLTFLLLWPLLDALLLGLFTSYFIRYLKDKLDERLDMRKKVSGVVISFIIVFLIAGFIYGVSSSIATLGRNIEAFVDMVSGSASFATNVLSLPEPFSQIVSSLIQDISNALRESLINSFGSLPKVFISLFIYLVTTFYFFFRGESVRNKIFMSLENIESGTADLIRVLIRSIYDLFNGVYIKRMVMALIIFVISSLGFMFLGVDFWQGWAVLLGITEFIPLIGNFLVYIPIGILYLALGSYWKGLSVIVFGLIFIDTLPELFIRSKMEVPRIKETPVLITLGIISGVSVLNLKGVIIGPILLIMFRDVLLHFQREEVKDSS